MVTNKRRFERSRPGRRDGFGFGEELRLAVVGLGYWGPNLLRVLFELPDATVKWVCDIDDERLAKAARRYPSVQATSCFDDLLDDDELDAVVIATPIGSHFDLASRSLCAGKHTLVEKPITASSAAADHLIELAEQHDVALMCGHTFLYSPAVRAVKRLIDAGELGEIYFISWSRVNLGLHQRDVSVIWDLGPHDFSILLYWLDETPEWVGAVGRDSVVRGIPDVAFLDLAFPSGTLGHVELSWLAPSKLRRTVVVGSKKMVVYDDTSNESVRVFDSGVDYQDPETFGEYQLSYRTGDILTPRLDIVEPLAAQLEDFLASIRSGQDPQSRPELARDVVRLIEAAECSLLERGTPASVESLRAISHA